MSDKSVCSEYPLSLDQGPDDIQFYYCAKCGFTQLSTLNEITCEVDWYRREERDAAQKNHDAGEMVSDIHEQLDDALTKGGVNPRAVELVNLVARLKKK